MSSSGVIVPPYGPTSADLYICGEGPGAQEANQRRPFCGPSGQYQAETLRRYGVDVNACRLGNVNWLYIPGDPDPEARLIAEYGPKLEADIRRVRPLVLLCVGRFAMRYFLGEAADLNTAWGIPFYAGEFDESRRDRAAGAVVMCTQHPAAALHAEREGDAKLGDIMANIDAGYERAAHVLRELRAKRYVFVRRDEFKGREDYRDVTGRQLVSELKRTKAVKRAQAAASANAPPVIVGTDTEGEPGKPWSIQVALEPGTSYVLRYAQKDFDVGVRALQELADVGARILTHSFATPSGCGYDIARSREMGLVLKKVWDTMASAWLLRLEPLGAKPLGLRYAGMRMASWEDTIGSAAREKQCEWLSQVLQRTWPKPEPQIEIDNAGVMTLKNPWRIERRVEEFLWAVYVENKDPYECWKAMNPVLKKQVEDVMGPMPTANLDDIALDDAIFYAARDSDAEVRMYPHLHAELARFDKLNLMDEIMGTLPIFERMQATGMPASRRAFEKLHDWLDTEMEKIRIRLSREYMGGRVFNPNASKHVVALMTRRGLESAARTKKTNAPSIGKKGIEHLRYVDPAMALRAEWKEMQHNRDAYCDPVLNLIPEGVDLFTLICKVKPNATTSTRIATEDPNYLGFPKHDKPGGVDEEGNKRDSQSYGKMIRGCFIAPSGKVFYEADYCLAPWTRVLTADLRWVAVETLKRGDRLVSIDEHRGTHLTQTGRTMQAERRMRTAVVQRTGKRVQRTRKLEFDDGTVVIASPDHPWLAKLKDEHERQNPTRWIKTWDLKVGDRIRRLVGPWDVDDNWESGWLAGFIDGEGCLNAKGGILTITQREGPTYDYLKECLRRRGYSFYESPILKGGFGGKRKVRYVCITGMADCMRLLGKIRPFRFMERGVEDLWEGKTVRHKKSGNDSPDSGESYATIVRVSDAGVRTTISVQTDTKTFVAEGLFTHNSQIEVRMLAHESRDELLCRLFSEVGPDGKPRDVHTETAARVFGRPVHEISKDSVERFLAKKVSFGIAYGTSGMGLADQLRMMNIEGFDADACDDFIREWLKLYKGAAKYFADVEKFVREHGWIEDFGKMRRYLLASRSRVMKLASEARRQAVNHRIQAGSQRLIQRAMIALDPKLQRMQARGAKVDLLLQVHDALLFLIDEKDLPKATKVITRTMVEEYGPKLRVPILVDSKHAQSWGQL